jgi:hypothetical protein
VLGGGSGGGFGGGFGANSSQSTASGPSVDIGGGYGPGGMLGPIPAVPEPGTWLLLAFGLIGLVLRARSNSNRHSR